jgi:hypothetical protein
MSTGTAPARPRVTGVTEALDGYLARQGTGGDRPPLRYLRRKPGRGLVAVFGPGERGDIYTVTVDERTLVEVPENLPATSTPTVRRFPLDPQLPHLDTVMAPSGHRALEAASSRPREPFTTCRPTGSCWASSPSPFATSPGTAA